MVHIYCGNGKGKTTAGFGLLLRQLGYGNPVGIVQFLKDGNSGEMQALKGCAKVWQKACVMPQTFYFQMKEEEQAALKQQMQSLFEEACRHLDTCSCMLWDEIIDAQNLGLLTVEQIITAIQNHPNTEIILTGRNPHPRLIDIADYYTAFQEVKHPFQKGIPARKGIEY